MNRRILYLLIPLVFLQVNALAQDGNKQTAYTNLALQFSSQNFNGDAATGFFPSIASAGGIGSSLENPASLALIEDSYFNIGFYNNQYDYQNSYLGNTIKNSGNTTNLSNLGFVYKLPTEQGSFVIGGGYNTLKGEDILNRINGRNSQSTITDDFREPDSDYYDIAFDTYATDWGDVDSTYLESIFRIGFLDYPGIDQDAKISYVTNLGEYSFFMGTEFKQNLFIGLSAGLISGSYTYRRDFLETDSQNDYNGDFIPSDISATGTDIESILTHDEIDADMYAFSLRTGLIYRMTPYLNLGISYMLPTNIVVRESYYASITTELDDGSTPFESDFASNGDYEYRIRKPAELSVGLALSGLGNVSASVSAEYIDYSNLSLDLISGNSFSFAEQVSFSEREIMLEGFMAANYKSVVNLKTGLGYKVNEQLKVKAGYALLPGKSKKFVADRGIFSGGITAHLAEGVVLDLNGQYTYWDDRSVLYDYYDYSANIPGAEVVDQKMSSFKLLAGLRFLF